MLTDFDKSLHIEHVLDLDGVEVTISKPIQESVSLKDFSQIKELVVKLNYLPEDIEKGNSSSPIESMDSSVYHLESNELGNLTNTVNISNNTENTYEPKNNIYDVLRNKMHTPDEKVNLFKTSTFTSRNEPCTLFTNQKTEKHVKDKCTRQLIVDDDGNIIIKPVKEQCSNISGTETSEIWPNQNIVKKHYGSKWTFKDTLKFYRVLHRCGTDFTSINRYFPERSRRSLKTKFKNEERRHGNLIDRILTQPRTFNLRNLQEELTTESNRLNKINSKELKVKKKIHSLKEEGRFKGKKRRRQRNVLIEDSHPIKMMKKIEFELPVSIIEDHMNLLAATRKLNRGTVSDIPPNEEDEASSEMGRKFYTNFHTVALHRYYKNNNNLETKKEVTNKEQNKNGLPWLQ